MQTLSKRAVPAFRVGDEVYRLTSYQQKLLNWQIVASKLVDESMHNWRFYNDAELLDLLDLQVNREGRNLLDLPKIYVDAGNVAPFIVAVYKALTLTGIDVNCVVVENEQGEVEDTQTETLRYWLEQLNEGGFIGMLDEVVEGGVLFGTSHIALRRKPDDVKVIEGIAKDAMMVFPVIDLNTNKADMVFTCVTVQLPEGGEVEEVEHYLPGEVNVYRGGRLVEELSGPTGTNKLTLVSAPYKSDRGCWYGKSALHGLIECIVQLCGAMGATYNTFRTEAGGIYSISTKNSASLEAQLKAMGGPMGVRGGAQRVLDPDSPSVLVGEDLSISMVQGMVMANAEPMLERLEQMLAMRCPVYAQHKLGANASGEALKQADVRLAIEMRQIRGNLTTLIARIADVLGDLYRAPLTGRVRLYAPDPFPPTTDELVARAITLLDKGVVPIDYVAEVAEVDDNPLVVEHLQKAKETAERATAQPQRSPLEDLFGMGDNATA